MMAFQRLKRLGQNMIGRADFGDNTSGSFHETPQNK
jgi:hypothetical protein